MSETSNVAAMANKLSNEIFGVFGWTSVGPTDINWDCTEPTHNCPTHPSDVVFWYDDPYQGDRVYVNFDLKSYAAQTLQKGKVTKALHSLANAVECANSGDRWRATYVDADVNWHCDGALFVYNHDHGFDKSFRVLFDEASATVRVPRGRRLCVFGPPEIEYLFNVATDILTLKGRGELPVV